MVSALKMGLKAVNLSSLPIFDKQDCMSDTAQFEGMIGPHNLISLVKNTAAFLFEWDDAAVGQPSQELNLIEMGAHPFGFVHILKAAERLANWDPADPQSLENYYALCLACHHATVATFVPTDVDSKIRGLLWQRPLDSALVRRRFLFCLDAMQWDISRISTRSTELAGVGPVSGHNGEMLGVLAGALGCFIHRGDTEYAELAATAIDNELKRELTEFVFALNMRQGEIEALKISMSLLHNVGDLDQGISFWKNGGKYDPFRRRFGRLGHENTQAYQGLFVKAGALYKGIMSSEGHRHYPLRDVKALRRDPSLLLPLGPFLDEWGATIARSRLLDDEELGQVLRALLEGCKKIPGQQGYFRAIVGMREAAGSRFDRLVKSLPTSARHWLAEPEIKKKLVLARISFESSMRKRAQAALAPFGPMVAAAPL